MGELTEADLDLMAQMFTDLALPAGFFGPENISWLNALHAAGLVECKMRPCFRFSRRGWGLYRARRPFKRKDAGKWWKRLLLLKKMLNEEK